MKNTPTKTLAKKIGLSESSTMYRLKNLVEQKIILGFSAIIDSYKLGYEGYRIYFNFFSTTTEKEEEIINWLLKQKPVSVLGLAEGDIDIAIHSWVKERKEFEKLADELKSRYKDCITNLRIDLYVGTHHFTKRHLLEQASDNQVITIGGTEKAEFDDLDLKIIRILTNDARKSVLQIAHELGKPASTITYRLRRLEKQKIISGYTINLNYSKLGLEYYKLGIIFSKNVSESRLVYFSSSVKQSIIMDKSLSDFDFELNIEIHSHAELISIINNIKNEFKGVRSIFWYRIRNYLKLEYLS